LTGVLVDSPHEKGMARVAARADGGRVERHPRSDDLVARGVSRARSTRKSCRGKPRHERPLARCSSISMSPTTMTTPPGRVRQAQAGRWWSGSSRLATSLAYPDALRFIIAVKDSGMHCRGRFLFEERRSLPGQDPARRLRRGAGDLLPIGAARTHAPGITFDADVFWARLRAREARSRNVPCRRAMNFAPHPRTRS